MFKWSFLKLGIRDSSVYFLNLYIFYIYRDCYWTLSTQPGKRFQFHFYSLIIGENSDCNEDYLSVMTFISSFITYFILIYFFIDSSGLFNNG